MHSELCIKIALYIFAIIGIFWCFVIGFDKIINFDLWQRRIHIGRWKDVDTWQLAVEKKCCQWLANTPVVPKNDSTRLVLFDRLSTNFSNTSIQSWQVAGLILGLNAVAYRFPESVIQKIIDKFNDNEHPDRALLSYALLGCQKQNASVKEFASTTRAIIENHIVPDGTVAYRKHCAHIRFVDTIGLACPFLALDAVMSGDSKELELAEAQIREYCQFLHPDSLLPPHAFNTHNGMPLGVYDWGRGLGWFILGIVECRRTLEKSAYDGDEFYKFLSNLVVQLAEKVITLQHSNGGFAHFLSDTGNITEGSATVLCGLLLEDAYRLTQRQGFHDATDKAINALMKITRRDGTLDMCQGDTKGVGVYSTQFARMPFAQGLCLLLSHRFNEDAQLG